MSVFNFHLIIEGPVQGLGVPPVRDRHPNSFLVRERAIKCKTSYGGKSPHQNH